MTEEPHDEAHLVTDMLAGKTVRWVRRHRPNEVVIEFDDGTRLFIDASNNTVELSITGG